jgi:hypothetical protein
VGGDDTVAKTVNLSEYGNNVDYGSGNAADDIPSGSAAPPADGISYASPDNIAVFSSTGTVMNPGASGSYVYLSNERGSCYGVGTPSMAGAVILRRWNNGQWE